MVEVSTAAVVAIGKKLIDFLRKSDNPELVNQIIDLQQMTLESVEDRLRLRARVSELEEQLRNRGRLVFRPEESSYFDSETGEGPYCSACFDSKQQVIRMHSRDGHHGCPVCRTQANTEAARQQMAAAAEERGRRIEEHNRRARAWFGNY